MTWDYEGDFATRNSTAANPATSKISPMKYAQPKAVRFPASSTKNPTDRQQ